MHPRRSRFVLPPSSRYGNCLCAHPCFLDGLCRCDAGLARPLYFLAGPLPRSLRASSTLELRHDHPSGTVGAKSSPDLKLIHADRRGRGEGVKAYACLPACLPACRLGPRPPPLALAPRSIGDSRSSLVVVRSRLLSHTTTSTTDLTPPPPLSPHRRHAHTLACISWPQPQAAVRIRLRFRTTHTHTPASPTCPSSIHVPLVITARRRVTAVAIGRCVRTRVGRAGCGLPECS